MSGDRRKFLLSFNLLSQGILSIAAMKEQRQGEVTIGT